VAIRYAKSQADKLNKPLIPDLAVLQKEKDSFIKEKSTKLLLNEESRVDAFIKGLRSKQYRSHTSPYFHQLKQSKAESQANKTKHTLHEPIARVTS